MKRRTVLTTLGASVASITTGCTALGHSSPNEGGAPDRDSETPTSTEANDSSNMEFNPKHIVDEIELGDPTARNEKIRPHSLTVWNKASVKQTTQIKITSTEGEVLDDEYDLSADTAVTIVLHEPAEYTADLQSNKSKTSITMEKKWFDCNRSSTNVSVNSDGQFDSQFVTTWLECGSSVTMPDETNSTMNEDT